MNRKKYINPISKRPYVYPLETGFGDPMTVVEKINDIILRLNKYGELNEEMLEKWNDVYRWVYGEGLLNLSEENFKKWLFTDKPAQLVSSILDKKGRNSHYDAVIDFGADNTGQRDTSKEIMKAIEQVIIDSGGRNNKTVLFFPAGTYRVKQDKLFSDIDFTTLEGVVNITQAGMTFRGAGKESTTILLETEGREKWLYDNGEGNNRFAHMWFEHMRFEADDPYNGHGFKQWSRGQEKQFRFFNCSFRLGKILECTGTGNADLNRFLLCNIQSRDTMFTLDNRQSVQTEFYGCNFAIGKDLVHVKKGGGSTRFIGGNFEMHNYDRTDPNNHYFVKNDDDTVTSLGSATINFTDGRVEMHGSNKRLVYGGRGASAMLNVSFTRMPFAYVSGGNRVAVDIVDRQRVVFENSYVHGFFDFSVSGTNKSSTTGALLEFHNNIVGLASSRPLYERIQTNGDRCRVISRGSHREQGSSGSIHTANIEDFDIGWDTFFKSTPNAIKKVFPLKSSYDYFPRGNNSETKTVYCGDIYVTRIYVNKPAVSTTNSDYQLIVKDGEGNVLGQSKKSPHSDEHIIDIHDAGYIKGGEIVFSAEGVSIYQRDGVAYIEYI